MNKTKALRNDMEKLMEDYYNAYMDSDVVVTPYRYRVQLDKNNATRIFKGNGESYYKVMVDGKVIDIQNLEFEFTHPVHFSREELLEYVGGTQGVKDVFGYRNEKVKRTKEEILDEIKEVVDELVEVND